MTADATNTGFDTNFAAEFPAGEADWRKAAEAALKGRPLDPLLNPKLIDGTVFKAIAPRAKANAIAGRQPGVRWTAMTRIDIGEPQAANDQVLEDLNNGASGLSLAFAGSGPEGGLSAGTVDQLDTALNDVMLDLAPVQFEVAAAQRLAAAALFAALVERRGQKPADVSILFGLDLLRDGTDPAMAADAIRDLSARGFSAPILVADQRTAHDAGASEAQELAGALASAVAHIRLLGEHGLDAETVADTLSFAFSADVDQFATIAKLRAARLSWAALRRELGLGDKPIHILVQTSRRMLTRNDAQTNIVRNTIAAFAAGVGGADSVIVLPHTAALGEANSDARRIARNVQSIVLEESNVYRVADPAAGAGAIELLTETLAEAAWDMFREIERDGGMAEAIRSGAWAARIDATARIRAEGVASRKIPIVGVSQFPKADEVLAAPTSSARPAPAASGAGIAASDFAALVTAFSNGASLADVGETTGAPAALALRRLSAPFEELRATNETRSPRPTVFVALLGPIARHAARAGFMRNLLEAGGLKIVDGPLDAEQDAIADAFKQSGASIAVVTGADGDYAEAGGSVTEALKSAGATVWLAGRPKDGREALEAAGVSRIVAAGDDAIDILSAASKANGAAS